MNGISKDYGAVSSVEELLEQEEKGKQSGRKISIF
jgi:ABC transporter, permease protein